MNDVETLVWEIPNLLNIRFARIETTLVEFSGRLVAVERAISMLQADMRDLRGGVTRQLVEQDRRLRDIETRLNQLEARFDGMDARFNGMEDMLKQILQKVS